MNSISLSCCLYFPKSIACHNNPLWFCIAFVKSISIGFCMGLNRSNSSRKISINCFWGGRHRRAGVHSWWWWVECREYREYDFGLSVYTGSIIDTCGDIVFSMRCHSNYYALVRVIGVRATSRHSREWSRNSSSLLFCFYPTNITPLYRSLYTYKMPNKPIKQGYKIYGIVDYSYLYNWIWSSREKGLQDMFYYPDLTNTGCLVRTLVLSLPRRFLTIYLDNYFTSVPLFKELRTCNFSVVSTTRLHKEFLK